MWTSKAHHVLCRYIWVKEGIIDNLGKNFFCCSCFLSSKYVFCCIWLFICLCYRFAMLCVMQLLELGLIAICPFELCSFSHGASIKAWPKYMQKDATGAGGHISLALFPASTLVINQGRVAAKHGCRNPAGKVFTQFHLHTQVTTWTGGHLVSWLSDDTPSWPLGDHPCCKPRTIQPSLYLFKVQILVPPHVSKRTSYSHHKHVFGC